MHRYLGLYTNTQTHVIYVCLNKSGLSYKLLILNFQRCFVDISCPHVELPLSFRVATYFTV